jgi:hypothetical protein
MMKPKPNRARARTFAVWIQEEAEALAKLATRMQGKVSNLLDVLDAVEQADEATKARIDQHDQQLVRSLEKLRREFGDMDPAFLGYSLGGAEALVTFLGSVEQVPETDEFSEDPRAEPIVAMIRAQALDQLGHVAQALGRLGEQCDEVEQDDLGADARALAEVVERARGFLMPVGKVVS